MASQNGLDRLLPVVASWFRNTYGTPTPPQRQGWPAIAQGRNTLILAPTGSGKTLAAFLACLDHLWRHPRTQPGARILYVSPLKALNQDISANLQIPLAGILEHAQSQGISLDPLTVAVRSGDTSPAERRRIVQRPPDILITTPESLHLMLTSRARETLRTLTHVIIDEIHALCPNKRGVFLALLLERLEALNSRSFVRVGLSATQRPLEEVARYLGGFQVEEFAKREVRFTPRPVTIVDAGGRKSLDLKVLTASETTQVLKAGATWPAIEDRLTSLIREHRSTIVFANNRRVVERLTNRLNELQAEDVIEPSRELMPIRSHHGSLSMEERKAAETSLKAGEVQAVVATGSLELGIDMGAVDLVCQVESPGNVARGLQRVGRAGHIVGRTSKGRLIAKTMSDLLESAALCRAMLAGKIEALRVPRGCLDILAQQVVACVAMDRWEVNELFNLVRCASPYAGLTPEAFDSVLRMVTGRFPTEAFRDLRARISWDRIHNRLAPLPGSARLAVTCGGTIPDTGQYPVYLGAEGPRLGELDEEFVHERRVGETFILGTSTWRIDAIETQRVLVSPAQGESAVVPFWRGEETPRSPELGEEVGRLSREIRERLDDPEVEVWLQEECRLEPGAASALCDHLGRQIRSASAAPDDRTVIVESFLDPAGELGLAILTPYGGKLHQALKLALQGEIKARFGISVASMHADDGILIRFPQTEAPPLDLLKGLTPTRAEALIKEELGESALFGLRFRQNAGRALLMPRPDPTKRTPLWLQRLRAKDLLQVVRKVADFPIVVETYRECLNDDLDLPRLREFLERVASGSIQVVTRRSETGSPFTSDLIFRFTSQYIYQWDEPKRSDANPQSTSTLDSGLLNSLLTSTDSVGWLDSNAIGQVESRLREVGRPPRTKEEMAETLRRLGDLTEMELGGPMLGFLRLLEADGRALQITLPRTTVPARWIDAEEEPIYTAAFAPDPDLEAQSHVIGRFLSSHALVGLDKLLARYPIDLETALEQLERWEEQGRFIRLESAGGSEGPVWAERQNLEAVRRLSVALRRRESVAVTPEVFADLVARRQYVHPSTRLQQGEDELVTILEQFTGLALPASLWEAEVLPRRLLGFQSSLMDQVLASGDWTWRATSASKGDRLVAFAYRDFAGAWTRALESEVELDEVESSILSVLEHRGAIFSSELTRELHFSASEVQAALAGLLDRGRVTNDRFDPIRAGFGLSPASSPSVQRSAPTRGSGYRTGPRQSSARRRISTMPEGRWSHIAPLNLDDLEAHFQSWTDVLLNRFGVLTRETLQLDPWAPAWKDLAPWLARAELRGDLRRGYFVEGLSGVQYTTLEVAEELAERAAKPVAQDACVMLCSLDPANLFGSGAPFDINLLEGGTARLVRASTNFIISSQGRPVLIAEAFGKRLTGLASASEHELKEAIGLLVTLVTPGRKVLKVETYNSLPAIDSPASTWLADRGFVRDYPGMTYYFDHW